MSRASRHLLLALLLSFAGCAQEDLKAKMKTIQANRAADLEAQSLGGEDVKLELGLAGGGSTWCPAGMPPAQLRATVHTKGLTLRTPLANTVPEPRSLRWSDLVVTASAGATVSPDGILLPPFLPLSLAGQKVIVEAHVAKKPAARAQLAITPTFDCDQFVTFAARPGRPGGSGQLRGENGEPGLHVVVGLIYVRAPSGRKLVLAKAVPSAGTPLYVALEPGRHLGVDVRGAPGGPGATTNVYGLGGGLGGDGGDGGRVEVYFDRQNPELREVVRVANTGGPGGAPGQGPRGETGSSGRPGRSGPPASYQAGDVEKLFSEEIQGGLPALRKGNTEI
jgi:hypothetical protein